MRAPHRHRPTYRVWQTNQCETLMKHLIIRAMCQPFVVVPAFYLVELMHKVDYSVAGALLVLAAKSMSRVVSQWSKE
ncbi:hypothetical protein CR51_41970 [Caballeronia megalochromosomata]|nr:hypothetical protein CR51_41970 [Caballeronia megalochromosomata]